VSYFVLGVALLAGFLLLARWMSSADPRLLAWLVRVIGGALLLGFAVFVFMSGRFHWLLYAVPFALPFYFHWRSNRIRMRNAQGPTPGGASEVDTGWLKMELDHDSGNMRGTVERGSFAGRGLAGMSLEELLELREELSSDGDSVRVLDSYLDRIHGPAWRGGEEEAANQDRGGYGSGHGGPPRGSGAMTENEAFEVLGLERGATADEIKDAHRRLMGKLHPDRGGSTYLAAKLNQAKDFLLKQG
jgi:hypothetical protein